MTNGVRGAWPLAFGVLVGDIPWHFTAILRLSWITSMFGEYLFYLKWLSALIFFILNIDLLRHADTPLSENKALSAAGVLPLFLAGLTAILTYPKTILFYMGILPGFFDLRSLTLIDIGVILKISAVIPMGGNIALAVLVEPARGLLHSAASVCKINIASRLLLIFVGDLIPLT